MLQKPLITEVWWPLLGQSVPCDTPDTPRCQLFRPQPLLANNDAADLPNHCLRHQCHRQRNNMTDQNWHKPKQHLHTSVGPAPGNPGVPRKQPSNAANGADTQEQWYKQANRVVQFSCLIRSANFQFVETLFMFSSVVPKSDYSVSITLCRCRIGQDTYATSI